jgi:hypothetical protein
MINILYIVKDSFEPSQVISTKHFYPKHLFKRVVQGKGDSSHVLKKAISHQIYAIQHLYVNIDYHAII